MVTKTRFVFVATCVGLMAAPVVFSSSSDEGETVVTSILRNVGFGVDKIAKSVSGPDTKGPGGSSTSATESAANATEDKRDDQKQASSSSASSRSLRDSNGAGAAQPMPLPNPRSREYTDFPRTSDEVSLDHMAKQLFGASHGHQTPKDLIQDLAKRGLEPVASQDFNPDTGKMVIVRTGENLPGTRYFHAQFFEGEDKKPFLQHMSFEFKPGPDAMDRALIAVAKNFPGLGEPTVNEQGFVSWTTKDGYVVWLKRLDADDLKSDPFNAYTKNDVGAVRAAIELNIHEDEHDH